MIKIGIKVQRIARMWAIRLINPTMKWVLQSPFHRVASNNKMVIQFTGRKTGKTYSTPVEFAQEGKSVYFVTVAEWGWWRNLRDGAPATAVIAARPFKATSQVVEDQSAVEAGLRKIYPTKSQDWVDGQMKRGLVLVTLTLTEN